MRAIDADAMLARLEEWNTSDPTDKALYNFTLNRILEQPTIEQQRKTDEWCTDCKEYDQERHCCPRWNRVIRQTLKDAQPDIIHCGECKYYHDSDGCFFSTATTGADGFCHWAERKDGEADETD